MINKLKLSLLVLPVILFAGCNTPQLNSSMQAVTKFDKGLTCKCTAPVINLVDTGVVTNVDTSTNTLTIKHDNGITSVIKNLETINPIFTFEKNKRILKGYIVGSANEKTTYEQVLQ